MPDDYYVSQYSGEEIDERLTAAHNAVRYDAAQSLTDEQKQQARGNIAAAPSGYGLGGSYGGYIADADNATVDGKYQTNSGTLNLPDGVDGMFGVIDVTTTRPDKALIQKFCPGTDGYTPYTLERRRIAGVWKPWEWVNHPMFLGKEYRTTERYLGKPVYVKVVDLGAGPSANTKKDVTHGISNMGHIVDYAVEMTVNGAQALPLPYRMGDENQGWVYVNSTRFTMIAGGTALTGYTNCYGWIKYNKTTD